MENIYEIKKEIEGNLVWIPICLEDYDKNNNCYVLSNPQNKE
jgi:hypothetical protein